MRWFHRWSRGRNRRGLTAWEGRWRHAGKNGDASKNNDKRFGWVLDLRSCRAGYVSVRGAFVLRFIRLKKPCHRHHLTVSMGHRHVLVHVGILQRGYIELGITSVDQVNVRFFQLVNGLRFLATFAFARCTSMSAVVSGFANVEAHFPITPRVAWSK